MTNIFVIVATADVEILSVRVFNSSNSAREEFEKICEEECITEETDLSHEAPGTIALAGDDTYAVQLFELPLKI